MLNIWDQGGVLSEGLSRRDMIRIGSLGLGGLTWNSLLSSRVGASDQVDPSKVSSSFGKPNLIIIFGLIGGTPQHETWDPKPDAPEEIRGEFGSIETKTPGLRVGELMPLTANWTDSDPC